VLFFTDRNKVKDFAQIVKNLPKNSIIIIREYDLKKSLREEFAKKIISYVKNYKNKNLKILIGKDFSLVQKLNLDGVHFSDFDKLPANFLSKNSYKKNFIFSFSCHSLKSILQNLKLLKPDILLISPIFETTSHKDSKIIGTINLAKIVRNFQKFNFCKKKLYALGGINSTNIKKVRMSKVDSFGAIDYFNKL